MDTITQAVVPTIQGAMGLLIEAARDEVKLTEHQIQHIQTALDKSLAQLKDSAGTKANGQDRARIL